MRKRLLLMALCLFWLPAAMADKPMAPEVIAGTMRVSAEEVVELAASVPGLVIIDSRYREEFAKGHIEGAINLIGTELKREDLARVAPNLDVPLLFYCNGERCIRSGTAAKKAVDWGYRRVYWFRDGWQVWMEKHLPVSK
jgi:rhodanese-related sulfurtransferase